MNIFYLHTDPTVAARAMTNKHIVKMILESAQLMSTAHRVLDGTPYTRLSKSGARLKRYHHPLPLYEATHINHPSAVWVRESGRNYEKNYALVINRHQWQQAKHILQHYGYYIYPCVVGVHLMVIGIALLSAIFMGVFFALLAKVMS